MDDPVLLDEMLKSQLLLEKIKPKTVDIMAERLITARDNIITAIATSITPNEKTTLIAIKAVIDEQISIAYSSFYPSLLEDYGNLSMLGYDSTNDILNTFAALEGTTAAATYANLSDAAIARILSTNVPIFGATLKDWAFTQQYNTNTSLRKLITIAILDGDSTQKAQYIARAIGVVEDKFAKVLRYEVNTIVRTAMQAALMRANDEVFNQHKGLIKSWRSVATLDSRTSLLCASLDGKRYSAEKYPRPDDVPDRPPRHMNCRSILVPETRLSQAIDGERPYAIHDKRTVNHRDGTTSTKFTVDKAGTVPGNTTFSQWFSKQDVSFQKDYLGASKYDKYANGASITDLYKSIRPY